MTSAPDTHFWPDRRLPVLLQTEAAECGLACLAMVGAFWGHRIDMAGMRRRFAVSLKGATLKGLIGMGEALGLSTRPVKLGLEHLGELKLPCIVHWDMNHFVVLRELTRGGAVVHDPAVGERHLSLADFSLHFTGVALELSPGASFARITEAREFKLLQLMGRVVGLKRSLGQLFVLALALQVCALMLPFYMQWVIDDALLAADRDLLTVLGVGFLGLVVVQSLIGLARSWVAAVLSVNLNFQWLGNAFGHLIRLPLPYFEKRHLGDIVSRFGSIQTIQHTLTSQFVEGVIDGVLVLGTLVVMLVYSVQLTMVVLATVVLYSGLRLVIYRALRHATAEQIIHVAKQQTHFLESVRGIQSVRLFGRGDERRIGWMNVLADQFNAELRIARWSMSHQTAHALLFGVERVLVIWLAALAVLDARFTAGMLFAFIGFKDQFSDRVASLIDKVFEFRMLGLHGERVADIVMAEPEVDTAAVESDPSTIVPSIELRGVSYRYADGEPLVLDRVDLTIPAGQCVAITGPSGCGKTTLVKLMLGLAQPTEGEVLIGGVPLRKLGLANLRRITGTVMQDDHLFSGSIADNICFFDPAPNQDDIEASARAAAIHDEIADMPMGYNSLVGDIGSGLSGGQKQRVLLARALYRRPRLMVLDEATSHLDIWNEQRVNGALMKLDPTRVIVAHRPETIGMAERVVRLQGGRLVSDAAQKVLPTATLMNTG